MWNLRFLILLLDARESMLAPSFLVALFSADKPSPQGWRWSEHDLTVGQAELDVSCVDQCGDIWI